LSLRTAPITAFDPHRPNSAITFNARFALRYGSARGTVKTDDSSAERLASVQSSFNSPFWPMVLASTSVGQEGVDFHWWCHSLVHWNLPSNPVDFEQREGRVHRFKGHAVRKNVAQKHRSDAMYSSDPDPWNAAFEAARAARPEAVTERLGDLWPWWVFPGDAKIQRWIPSLPFSKDIERDERLRRLRGMYRLAFGQPRQEELLELFGPANGDSAGSQFAPLDLRPPSVEA
jgi:Helicase conserved C-terminal domain